MYTFKKINGTCSGKDNQREKNTFKHEYINLLKNDNTYLLEGLLKSLKISNEKYSLLKYKIKINFKDSIIELKKEKRIKRGKNKKLLKSKTFKKSKNFATMIRENSNAESLYYNLNELRENSFHPKLKNISINDTIIENTLDGLDGAKNKNISLVNSNHSSEVFQRCDGNTFINEEYF